ncbi:dioxygenase [Oscillatoria sp. FACHB-1407]|uniref:dioxygenase family protein n=1 Tax=Oscillatoria sp. FACHB-1407 TaxID=2692847 RepID=UPI0016858A04|nr:class III extradiol ring-cleavage dioxygenase [Oscillatoria sp. FACHB-1407]MBD2461917.1 dioxygenase [Oscillatoria sp. FACHB-1407]
MTTLPAIFISHGSPDLLLQSVPAVDFLKQLGTQFSKPNAILVVSAHWLTQNPTVSCAPEVPTIHDFGGFSPVLYQMKYGAPGAPALAKQVATVLSDVGFDVATDVNRGLDHGAWEPLMLMYPNATIPVTQLSIQPRMGTRHHLSLGRALAQLREEGVLILASGAATHNLRMFGAYDLNDAPPDWVTGFDRWLAEAIAHNDTEALLNYRQEAPYAIQNHPTDEHLLPLFVALGAGGETPQRTQLHSSFTYGVFSMAAYAFA